jgi:5-methylcytosine-specific restriction endonuclease McrBC regulatory subunit McrC
MYDDSRLLTCVEGEPFWIDTQTRIEINAVFAKLQRVLRFRSWPLSDASAGKLVIRGIVGAISLSGGRTLEITPKTEPADDWVASVLSLLLGPDRIDAGGERSGGLSAERKALLPLLAAIYATRLERALRRDGPLLLLQQHESMRTALRGKLNASSWLRHALHRPHIFPTELSHLTADNGFTNAMAAVAGQLSNYAGSPSIRARLIAAQKDLRPGLPPNAAQVPPGVELRHLPSQWLSYDSAWKIASAILARRSLLGPSGRREAVSVAIEAWPLLERLLTRTLRAVARRYERQVGNPHVAVHAQPPSKNLLVAAAGSTAGPRSVVPDGWLQLDGETRATFDAKYKRRETSAWPNREDIYQVLCTASAFRSPLAVLVYPEHFDPVWWDVPGMDGYPSQMVAVGIGLYSYRAGIGDQERSETFLDLLVKAGVVPIPLDVAGAVAA